MNETKGAICPVCKKNTGEPLESDFGETSGSRIFKCRDCGTVYEALYYVSHIESSVLK